MGLLISKDLTSDEQVEALCVRQTRQLPGLQGMSFVKKEVMKKIYICLIRPYLEYCVQLWSPVAAHGSCGTIYEIQIKQFVQIKQFFFSFIVECCKLTIIFC